MMEGIQVLHNEVVYTSPVIFLIITIMGLVLLGVGVMFINLDYFRTSICCLTLGGAMMLAGLICGATIRTVPMYNEYKVIIDDSVSMTEFFEKYEVIKQEGEIYTIRDKSSK